MTEQQYENQKRRIESEVKGVKVKSEKYGKKFAVVVWSPNVSPAPTQTLHNISEVDEYLKRAKRAQ